MLCRIVLWPERYVTLCMQAYREVIKAEAKGDVYNLPPREQLLGSVSRGSSAAGLQVLSCPLVSQPSPDVQVVHLADLRQKSFDAI
jgi:hypothetical protein